MSYNSRINDLSGVNLANEGADGLIKNSDWYLVFRYKASWNGGSAINIRDNVLDVFDREYDCTINAIGSYRNGKVLECMEYHHDVPQGHRSYIVALSKAEYERIENANYSMRKKVIVDIVKPYL